MPTQFQHPFQEGEYGIIAWYPKFQSCHRFFVEHAQHTEPVQAVAAWVNIRLPFQQTTDNVVGAAPTQNEWKSSAVAVNLRATLVPYIRRLVVTGFDNPATLYGFFGEDWTEGIGPIHEAERRNYLFAAKSETWLEVKRDYDMDDGQAVPFLRPLIGVTENEIVNAEARWSDWLAMQDWMLGPRAPLGDNESRSPRDSRDG
ncbi:uncharacterized protein UV8b_03191 [Ustilaginoidea virens]|uniref:Ilp is an apoptosis inhibitor n=1 Tax=Ustilaginoidea virens TaxID=1159556 RepID=A0A8E5HNX2_USTVR|nr:uncharacterized protein UV8b_03191 [Ustilaginoidea virens]QUC18950.1 hypothetical protein UV8b_03191 [Ustilaginoidea virens]